MVCLVVPGTGKVPKGSCAKNAEVEIAFMEVLEKLPINLYFMILGPRSLLFRYIMHGGTKSRGLLILKGQVCMKKFHIWLPA